MWLVVKKKCEHRPIISPDDYCLSLFVIILWYLVLVKVASLTTKCHGRQIVLHYLFTVSFNFNALGSPILKLHHPFAEGHIMCLEKLLNIIDEFINTLKMATTQLGF